MPAAPDILEAAPVRPVSVGSDRLVDRVLVALGRRDYRAEAAALALALQSAPESTVPGVVDQLITLSVDAGAHPAGVDALGFAARGYARVPKARKDRLLATGHGRWSRACELGLSGATDEESASIVDLIADACDPLAVPLLPRQLFAGGPVTRAAAGRALIHVARRANRAPALDELTRQSIEAVIAAAAADFDKHRNRDTLIAVILLLSTPAAWAAIGPELAALLNDVQHPTHMALRSVLRSGGAAGDESLRAAAWIWLSRAPFRNACIERLNAPGEAGALEPIFQASHLRLHPGRTIALSRARDRRRSEESPLADAPARALEAPAIAAAGALAILNAVSDDGRTVLAEGALADDRPAVRAAGLLELVRTPDGGDDLLLDYVWDQTPAIARSALIHAQAAARTGRLGMDILNTTTSALAASPHDALRTLANLGDSAEASVLHRRARGNPELAVERLRTLMRTGPTASRIEAIGLARRLSVVPHVELELLSIIDRSVRLPAAGDAVVDELRVAATAAGALADAPTRTAEHALLRCLEHADDRIRANALDALIRRSRRTGDLGSTETPLAPVIVELKADAHHRVRASAVRGSVLGAMRSHDGDPAISAVVEPLGSMLTDHRPMHRVSGLWLSERIASTLQSDWHSVSIAQTLFGETERLANADGDDLVRARARRTSARLQVVLRTGWGDRAGAMA